MTTTFASPTMPFGQRFQYEVENVTLPQDNTYFVTVVYSTPDARTGHDQYLRWWFYNHPALNQVRQYTNFREMHINDPQYHSYLSTAIPQTPAVLVTLPPQPGEGYIGRVVYCAYGQHLSTNPNQIARELQAVFNQETYHQQLMEQEYAQTVQINPNTPVTPLPPVKPTGFGTTDTNTLLIVGGAVLLLFMFLRGRRRR